MDRKSHTPQDLFKSLDDGWTVLTADGSLSAHFEHTVLIHPDGPRLLTVMPAATPVE